MDAADLLPDTARDRHAAKRHGAAACALGEGDDVGDRVRVLEREPAAGAPEPGHDLVADPEEAVRVAQAAELFQPAGRRDEHAAARSADALQQDGGGAADVEAREVVAEPADALGPGGAAGRHREPVDLGGGDPFARLDQRAVGGGVPGLAGCPEGAGGVAVIADRTRREPVLVWL